MLIATMHQIRCHYDTTEHSVKWLGLGGYCDILQNERSKCSPSCLICVMDTVPLSGVSSTGRRILRMSKHDVESSREDTQNALGGMHGHACCWQSMRCRTQTASFHRGKSYLTFPRWSEKSSGGSVRYAVPPKHWGSMTDQIECSREMRV